MFKEAPYQTPPAKASNDHTSKRPEGATFKADIHSIPRKSFWTFWIFFLWSTLHAVVAEVLTDFVLSIL